MPSGKVCSYRAAWSAVRHGARVRGIELKVSMDEAIRLLESQDHRCALSGIPIHLPESFREFKHSKSTSTASLDRIDSGGCYELSNIQWIHKKINLMKNAIPQAEFIEFCKAVALSNL
jgi:hypothetical protein